MIEVWQTREREVLVEGPAGSGKTRVDLELDLWLASTYPRMRILWTRATLTSLRQSILVTFEEHVLGGQRHPCQHGKASRDHRMSYRFPNGSEIVLGGLDDPAKTYSMEYSKFAVFEAIQASLDSYERLLRLLRWPHGPFRQARLETNPGHEANWINRRPERLKANGKPQLHRIRTLHRDNPMFWDYERDCLNQWGEEYVNESLAGMSGDRRQNMLDGVWTAGSGMVWPEYDRSLHLIEKKFVPSSVGVYVAAMDFGFNAPGCLQVWGTDGTGRWYRVAEVYRTGWNINQWADTAAELWAEYRFRVGVADCAEPGSIDILNKRIGRLGGNFAETCFIAANKSRGKQHGLNQVRAALDPAQEGGPRLFLVKGALRGRDEKLASEGRPTCTEEEIPGYQFQEPDPEKPLRETPDPKYPNEGCDAMEYFWTWVFGREFKPEPDHARARGKMARMMGIEDGLNGRKRRR